MAVYLLCGLRTGWVLSALSVLNILILWSVMNTVIFRVLNAFDFLTVLSTMMSPRSLATAIVLAYIRIVDSWAKTPTMRAFQMWFISEIRVCFSSLSIFQDQTLSNSFKIRKVRNANLLVFYFGLLIWKFQNITILKPLNYTFDLQMIFVIDNNVNDVIDLCGFFELFNQMF